MAAFEYSGGALCLDLANTWGNRADPASDRLAGYADLLRWAKGAGLIGDRRCGELEVLARRSGERASEIFGLALELRETVFNVCAATAAGDPPPAGEINILNRLLASLPRQELCCGGPCCEWHWSGEGPDLGEVLWPAIQSAADLLTSPEAARVRECAAPDCNWLFLDHSRGGRRRWCDMSSCGNRAKARRYYARHHQSS